MSRDKLMRHLTRSQVQVLIFIGDCGKAKLQNVSGCFREAMLIKVLGSALALAEFEMSKKYQREISSQGIDAGIALPCIYSKPLPVLGEVFDARVMTRMAKAMPMFRIME